MKDSPALESLVTELDVLIRSSFSLIAVETPEEPRFRRAVDALLQTPHHDTKDLYWWSRPRGLRKQTTDGPHVIWQTVDGSEDSVSVLEIVEELATSQYAAADEESQGALFVLADYTPYISSMGTDDPEVVRRLRELAWELESTLATVVFVCPAFPRVEALEREVRVLTLPLPDRIEVGNMLDSALERLAPRDIETAISRSTHERIVGAALGLTAAEFSNNFYRSVVSRRVVGDVTVADLLREKNDAVRRMGFELTDPAPADHFGGNEDLMTILDGIAATYSDSAREYGLRPSKGILLFGYPGTGKDLAMRVASSKLNKPLLRVEMGQIVGAGGGVLGGGMERLRSALSIAEAVGAIIGLSEFEKGFGGLASSNQSDGGETARLISYFLNYMQEAEGQLFFGTANDISALRGEQLRAGRFDQLVFMDVPGQADRADIFRVHLTLRNRDPKSFDLAALAVATEGFTGAEIEAAVNGGMLRAFRQEREFSTQDIIEAAKSVTPVAHSGREQMEKMLEYAQRELGLSVHRKEAKTAHTRERAYRL